MKRALAIAAVFGGLALLEQLRPLRRRTQVRARRMLANAVVGAIGAGTASALQHLALRGALRVVQRRRFGLARAGGWPVRIAGVVLLDYTLWHWHRLLHRVPALWALHASHHADLDLDLSTALRFHVGELVASVPFRIAQVLAFGIDRPTLRAWETATACAVLFHHANLALPARLDAALGHVVMTPRLHGIHHSARPNKLDTNFATIFTWWDMLHRTRETEVDNRALEIGLPHTLGGRTPGVVESLILPLSPQMVAK